MNRSIQLKKAIPLIVVALACFALLPRSRAVSPPPDGGYPNETTAEGHRALFNLTTGFGNTALGFNALFSNTTGDFNTAVGADALLSNTDGLGNTATGFQALTENTTGDANTANGYQALLLNTTGRENTATGFDALLRNTTGDFNTANGSGALFSNRTGNNNTAIGLGALLNSTTSNNTATGALAIANSQTGNNNTANGALALVNNTAGSNNIAIGYNAGLLTTGDKNIDIGNQGVRDESNTIRIGTVGTQTKTFIAGISDAAIGGMEVRVNQNGRLGTEPSSKRFKELIKPMDKASEVLLALRPVTFRYRPEIDPDGVPQFGLIAEDVEKVNPDLVIRDQEGKPYSVRYDAVNAILLNEFLKEHRKVEQLTKAFESKFAEQQKQIERLTAGLQKVSEQLSISRPAPQTVNNP